MLAVSTAGNSMTDAWAQFAKGGVAPAAGSDALMRDRRQDMVRDDEVPVCRDPTPARQGISSKKSPLGSSITG
ncbi:hypothetical protein P171DRAFT_428242 [Karstenula rhodostoma CBS 690.94]|uniref:Uncharacterized protein n=1 Tax=Karstenula rhodostoma CBS 690.94 TaxID=1392251 RepID=A0A9P4PN02_9PLEO|nr:hypothetical protein P171DRAFT_428242 [Karstenula rhodostoma CBS 690.94]